MTKTADYGLAAALRDSQGPPEPVECPRCDGDRVVEVAAYRDRDGVVWDWPDDMLVPTVICPRCCEEEDGP